MATANSASAAAKASCLGATTRATLKTIDFNFRLN